MTTSSTLLVDPAPFVAHMRGELAARQEETGEILGELIAVRLGLAYPTWKKFRNAQLVSPAQAAGMADRVGEYADKFWPAQFDRDRFVG